MKNEETRLFVISVYSENQVGLLSSISNIFTRRNINIESLNVFPSEFPGIHHFTFRIFSTQEEAATVVKFIEKKVDVIRAFYYECDEVSAREHDVISAYLKEHSKENQ